MFLLTDKHDNPCRVGSRLFQLLQWRHNERDGVLTYRRLHFTQLLVQAQLKENIKAPRHLALRKEFTGDRWIPCTKGQ